MSAGGTCRRQRGDAATTFSSSARFVKRTTYFLRRRCTSRYASSASATSGEPPERDRPGEGHRRLLSICRNPTSGLQPVARRSRARRARRRASAARAATSSRSAAASSSNCRRSLRLRVSTRSCRPVSGSTNQRSPTSGSCCSRGSRISTAITSCRAARRSSGGAPVARAAEVRDDDDERAPPREPPDPAERVRRATSARPAPGPAPCAARAAAAAGPSVPCRGGEVVGVRSPKVETASRLPRRAATWPTASDDALGDVPLAPVGGAERHRRGRVEHEPRLERPLGDVQADVRLAGAGGHVPVDAAHVVAELVRPHLRELGAVAERPRAVVAGEQAVDAPAHRQVEVAQQRARESAPGPGRAGVRAGRERAGRRAHATAPRARSSCGISIASSTRSSTVSASTPSASAS